MIDYMLIIPILASFLIAFAILPLWIRKAKQIGLLWGDMNKLSSNKVAGSGGIVTVLGFIVGTLLFIAYRVFYLKSTDAIIESLALLNVVLIASGIGLIDDLLGWQRGGLSRRSRLLMMLFAAIPLMVINAGHDSLNIPFLGAVNIGIIYPLIIIPLGIIGATTTFNFLAGFNGLEAGQGIIIIGGLSFVSFFTGSSWLSIIGLCMVASLAAFLWYNKVPAKVFPGDVLTYSVGSLIAVMAVLGNFERIAVFFFIPYIIETVLKARGGLVKQSFGVPKKDGSLDLKYPKIYGLTHLSIWIMKRIGIKPTEKRAVLMIWAFQIVIVIIGIWIFRDGIFIR